MVTAAHQISNDKVPRTELKVDQRGHRPSRSTQIGALGPRAREVASNLATVFAMRDTPQDERIRREIAAAIQIRQELRHIVGKELGKAPASSKQ